jgi:hypothetical protein
MILRRTRAKNYAWAIAALIFAYAAWSGILTMDRSKKFEEPTTPVILNSTRAEISQMLRRSIAMEL